MEEDKRKWNYFFTEEKENIGSFFCISIAIDKIGSMLKPSSKAVLEVDLLENWEILEIFILIDLECRG